MRRPSPGARECIADILCDYPEEKRVLPLLLGLMDTSKNTALIASYIAKFGDAQALPRMMQALEDPAINYLDYVEIANAVRALGGEIGEERSLRGRPLLRIHEAARLRKENAGGKETAMQEKRITVQDVKQNEKLAVLIDAANRMLEVIGYTEHGPRHVGFVSHTARSILEQLHYPERMCELAAIAGWVHDVGNAVNRVNHGITGGALLFPILQEMGMPMDEVVTIVGAVGNHEEQNGKVVSAVSAALIIADKSDAHRTRVRRASYNPDDIHDRVNFAIAQNAVEVDPVRRIIRFALSMDESSSVMDFMEIYLTRMQMCEEAANFLGCRFELVVNGVNINRTRQDAPRGAQEERR